MRAVVKRLTSAAALGLTVVTAAAAQPPARPAIDPVSGLTIEQAIEEALRGEPMLGASRAEVIAARGERHQAESRPNPEVMFEQREQAGGTDRQTTIGLDLPLDVFRRGARIETADRSVALAESSTREVERRVAIAVRERYGQVLEAARRVAIADEVVAASRRTYELLRGRAQEGAAPPLERDVSLVELRRMESLRELAAGRLAVALAAMKRQLGRPAEAELSLRGSFETIAEAEIDTRIATRAGPAAGRPDVQEAEARVAVAEAQTEEARQDAKPEIGIFGSYMKMNQGFSQSGFNALGQLEPVHGVFHNAAAGIRVSVPILNRGQGAVAAAQARELAAAEVLRARRLDAASEVAAAMARVDAARRAAASYSADGRALARRNLDVMQETFALGRVTLFDVVNEQRRYLDFESSYTDVLAELFAAVTAFRAATGDIR
jgi:cobalt-zinc-cadmium efflux system outer membrane protein